MADREARRARAEAPAMPVERVAIVGDGRVGRAVATALAAADVDVHGPLRRGESTHRAPIVLLAVPDAEIAVAASALDPGTLVGHFSGATSLEPLAAHDAFSIHPLTTVTGAESTLAGVPAAVAGASARSLAVAMRLSSAMGMRTFDVSDTDRAAYHAAASIASNFLLALEDFAEQLAGSAGVTRDVLGPLVHATVENWQRHGAAAALTGPIARGDHATVERQRAAVAERLPERLALFDALAQATYDLAASRTNGGGMRS